MRLEQFYRQHYAVWERLSNAFDRAGCNSHELSADPFLLQGEGLLAIIQEWEKIRENPNSTEVINLLKDLAEVNLDYD